MHRKGGGMTAFRYKAFISYSWADAAWGAWLQKAIETYRTPAALVGKDGALGPVPARLHPLFKDREEEAAGASIGAAVETALAASEFLIVVCSPNSAKSQWVNRELAWFKTHRDPAKVLALIVDGSPGSGGENECFPLALTHHIAPDLTITGDPTDHPLAADARDSGDGKRKARLKLAAALLGVGLDELVRRDDRRRALRVRLVVGASLALALAMSALALAAVRARDEADFQRAESDGLVEFMLTDLREKLEPVGRLDALDVVGQRALKYYAGQKASKLDADALGRRARALHLVGEVRDVRGDSESALQAFREAAATTGEQLARDPDNPQRIFDHAQSVYWVGYVAYQRGELEIAEAAFLKYRKYAAELVSLDPKEPKWQMERKYSESNLGALYFEQGRFLDAEQAFGTALQMVDAVAESQPFDVARQIEVGNAISWLATTQEYLGKRQSALALLQREFSIYGQCLRIDPRNQSALHRLVNAFASLARIKLANGDLLGTQKSYETALVLSNRLLGVEHGNSEWLEVNLALHTAYAEALILAKSYPQARVEITAAHRALAILKQLDPKNAEWGLIRQTALLLVEARLERTQSNTGRAISLLESIRNRLPDAAKLSQLQTFSTMQRQAALLMGDIYKQRGESAKANESWQAALAPDRSAQRPLAEFESAVQFAVLRRLGRIKEASVLANELDRANFRHPYYLLERAAATNLSRR
jgi:tetratricopeptide (TPR) repeat protein